MYETTEESVLDLKMQDRDVMLAFIDEAGPDYLTFMLLLLDPRSLPIRDGSTHDDKRVDDIEEARSNLISDFYEWASSTGKLEAWVAEYIAEVKQEAEEERAAEAAWDAE